MKHGTNHDEIGFGREESSCREEMVKGSWNIDMMNVASDDGEAKTYEGSVSRYRRGKKGKMNLRHPDPTFYSPSQDYDRTLHRHLGILS